MEIVQSSFFGWEEVVVLAVTLPFILGMFIGTNSLRDRFDWVFMLLLMAIVISSCFVS